MTSKHNRNKIRTKKTHAYQQQAGNQPEHTEENTDSKINEDSKTSDTIQDIDWHEVIKKTTGDVEGNPEE